LKPAVHAVVIFVCSSILPLSAAGQQTASPSSAAETTSGNEPVCSSLVEGNGRELLPKLCEFALNYRRHLPDFIAQQTTTQDSRDKIVVDAQVTFRQGREYYSHLAFNGRAVPSAAALPPSVRFASAGEFGSQLLGLFQAPDETEFKFKGTGKIHKQPVFIYEFHVPKEKNTFWTIKDVQGRTMKPELRGEVWLEPASGRPLREQLAVVHLPDDWSTRSVKTVTEYAVTTLGDLGSYMLPVRSEIGVCIKGIVVSCVTHTIVFHDYQKFGASTRILDVQMP
jgi:hypothetical protein